MKKFLAEFKDFAIRGNVVDMAVGVVIGSSFKGIIDSLVNNVLTPFIGLFINQDFSLLSVTIGDVQIKYGLFIASIISFLLMAFVVFLLVKMITFARNFGRKDEPVEEPTTQECPFCKTPIHKDATRCPNCTSQIELV